MNDKRARIILGINEDEKLTEELIKKKYRNKALKCHPDKNKSKDSNDKFLEVKNAHDYLNDKLGVGIKTNSYSELLYDFLKEHIQMKNTNTSANLLNIIIEKLTDRCEVKMMNILENIDKGILMELYRIIMSNDAIFGHIDKSIIEKLKNIIGDRSRNDEVIILNPTIDDLLEFNVYKCCIHGKQLIIPLWNRELVYDISCSDIYIKCNPVLHDNHFIDEYNNIHVKVALTISDIWNKTIHEVNVGKKVFELKIEELKMKKYQSLTLKNRGIPRINRKQIYDVSVLGDVVTHIHIEQ
tara:strand:+ start:3147 stop:4037 length:891 start_codon:yes stop_codon:yes gene_type:complete